MGGEHKARETRGGREVLGLRMIPTPEEIALLGSSEHFFDSKAAGEAQLWGLPLLRAAMPLIRRQENRLARFGGDRPQRRRP